MLTSKSIYRANERIKRWGDRMLLTSVPVDSVYGQIQPPLTNCNCLMLVHFVYNSVQKPCHTTPGDGDVSSVNIFLFAYLAIQNPI